MSDLFESVSAKISSQQSRLDEYDPVYQVGEQLKEIACESESNAELGEKFTAAISAFAKQYVKES